MKTLVLIFLLFVAGHGEALAYQNDVLNIHETTGENSPEAKLLMRDAAVAIEDALLKDFPCLKIFTKSQTQKALDALKQKEFMGPSGGEWIAGANASDADSQERYTTAEEEERFQASLRKKMDEFNKMGDAKYIVTIMTTAKPVVIVRVNAVNKFWTKRSGLFYQENKVYPTTGAAIADIKRIADELAKAFVEEGSNDKGLNNEVCPFKGNVEVRAKTKRNEQREETFTDYCNGQDHQGRKTETVTVDGKHVWKFQRNGNPDTDGTMEGNITEKIVREEITGCHECASGRKGEWSFRDETESAGSVSGLDTSTWSMKTGTSDNKDATIRLHFSKNGTYKVSVRAVSREGTEYVTKTTTAVGACDNLDKKPKTGKQPLTIPLERQFGPFTGTVRDKRLKDKQVLVISNKENEEVTEFEIEFDLKRPDSK